MTAFCSFPVTAKAADNVNFRYREYESATVEGLEATSSTMWKNARDALLKQLAKKTGGSFEK